MIIIYIFRVLNKVCKYVTFITRVIKCTYNEVCPQCKSRFFLHFRGAICQYTPLTLSAQCEGTILLALFQRCLCAVLPCCYGVSMLTS